MKRTVFISAGHSNVAGRDRGAVGNGFIEGVLTAELRSLIVPLLRNRGVTVVVDSDNSILSQTLNYFRNKTTPNCIVLDIHFNASIPSATGTETLIPANPSIFEQRLARDLSKACADVLGIPLRGSLNGLHGVKTELESHHGRLGWMQLTGENVLMEVCFITNAANMRSYESNKYRLANEIAIILAREAGYDTRILTHTVVSGDTLWSLSRRYGVTVSQIQQVNNLESTTIKVGQVLTIAIEQ